MLGEYKEGAGEEQVNVEEGEDEERKEMLANLTRGMKIKTFTIRRVNFFPSIFYLFFLLSVPSDFFFHFCYFRRDKVEEITLLGSGNATHSSKCIRGCAPGGYL